MYFKEISNLKYIIDNHVIQDSFIYVYSVFSNKNKTKHLNFNIM